VKLSAAAQLSRRDPDPAVTGWSYGKAHIVLAVEIGRWKDGR
jgi:hypothetical protein